MTRVQQLEKELYEKNCELDKSLITQALLSEQLINLTNILKLLRYQFDDLEIFLKFLNQSVYDLKHENEMLKLSNDEWVKRAINLEFEVLSARNAAKNNQ